MNYPFKHGVKRRFNQWAAQIIDEQIKEGKVLGIKPFCGMTMIKAKVLEWALESWKALSIETLLILKGWQRCLIQLYDVNNKDERTKAMASALKSKADIDEVPLADEDEEVELDEEGFLAEESEDEEKTKKQVMKERVYGERKSSRHCPPPEKLGYFLSTSQLKFS